MSLWNPRPTDELLSGGPPRPVTRITTSRTELLHLGIAFLVLTFDIAIVRAQISVTGVSGGISWPTVVTGLGIAAVATLTGFVAHEMAHKIMAQRHGFWAEFRMSLAGLFFSVATALFGFLFALPGATVIGGMGSTEEWGRTSLAGPVTNLVFGAAFLGAAFASLPLVGSAEVWVTLTFLAFVNAVFAGFNLIPLGALDGRKVLRWSRAIWVGSFGAAAIFLVAVLSVLFFFTPTF